MNISISVIKFSLKFGFLGNDFKTPLQAILVQIVTRMISVWLKWNQWI